MDCFGYIVVADIEFLTGFGSARLFVALDGKPECLQRPNVNLFAGRAEPEIRPVCCRGQPRVNLNLAGFCDFINHSVVIDLQY